MLRGPKAMIWTGGILAVIGIVALQLTTPSMGSYLELIVAFPLTVTGVVLVGVGLVLTYRPK
jgi:hypothetical protein